MAFETIFSMDTSSIKIRCDCGADAESRHAERAERSGLWTRRRGQNGGGHPAPASRYQALAAAGRCGGFEAVIFGFNGAVVKDCRGWKADEV